MKILQGKRFASVIVSLLILCNYVLYMYCRKYAATVECVLQNSMTCHPDKVTNINTTMYVIMSTLGRECMKLAAMQSNTDMKEMSAFPLLTAVHNCQQRPVCTTRWLDCAPDMNATVVCK